MNSKNHDTDKDTAEQKINKLKDKASEIKDEAYSKAADLKDDAEKGIRHTIDDVKEKFNDTQENLVQFVQKHPFQAVLYSMLAGVVTAKFLLKQ